MSDSERPSKRRRLAPLDCAMTSLCSALQALPLDILLIIHGYGLDVRSCVAAGDAFTVARVADGTLWGWGRNRDGQLGDGSDRSSLLAPAALSNIRGVRAVSAGHYHTIVLMDDGTLLGFGANGGGQLGNGCTTTQHSPVVIPGIHNAQAVACGEDFTVVLLADGTLRSFGENWRGQLGNGSHRRRACPVKVLNVSDAQAIACGGNHTVALLMDGTLMAFGDNCAGQLGDGSTTRRHTPVAVPGISNAVQIACGYYHTVVLLKDGTVRAFGANNYGQLGNGSTALSSSPVTVLNIERARSVACSGGHSSFVVDEGGNVYGFGDNRYGQLADGSTTERLLPVRASLPNVIAVFGGFSHVVALCKDGALLVWGESREVGDGSRLSTSVATVVADLSVF